MANSEKTGKKPAKTTRTNFYYGDKQLHPFMPLPLNHVVECPTNWLMDPDLRPVHVCALLVMLAHATVKLEVQISRKQIGRILRIRFTTAALIIKRLVSLGYVERLPYENGFIPRFKIVTKLLETKKRKPKKSNVFGRKGLSADQGGGSNRDRGRPS